MAYGYDSSSSYCRSYGVTSALSTYFIKEQNGDNKRFYFGVAKAENSAYTIATQHLTVTSVNGERNTILCNFKEETFQIAAGSASPGQEYGVLGWASAVR